MENTQLPIHEEDVFSSRDSTNKPSSSRIHFPPNESVSTRPHRTRAESHKGLSSLTPPVRRGSPLNPQNVNQGMETRRRPWISDLPLSSLDASTRHRRNLSLTRGSIARNDLNMKDTNMNPDGELEVGMFSDEYDLSHEDPRILQDVQRALKMKARREARTNAETTATPDRPTSSSSPVSPWSESGSRKTSPMIFPTGSSTSPSPLPLIPKRKLSNSTSSDVDFSPAIGSFNLPPQEHPIPSSVDNGRTLDWTGSVSDDHEKKWALSIGKRKEKDKLAPLTMSVSEQEKLYQEKLSRINRMASPQTLRKADITSGQLDRRYNLMSSALETKKHSLNLVGISRWYASQPEVLKITLEKAEPFTWLKHLDRRTGKTRRSRWNLSALIIEQYLRIENNTDYMQTIPEDATLQNSLNSFPRKSRSPSFSSRGPVGTGLGSSLSMGLTIDDRISFEPLGESKRTSLDVASRKSVESTPSSIRSGSSKAGMLSPTSSHVAVGDPRSSNYAPFSRPRSSSSSSSLESSDSLLKPEEPYLASSSLIVPGVSVHPPSTERLTPNDASPIPLTLAVSQESSSSSQKRSAMSPASQSVTSLKGSLNTRRVRMSLPSHKSPGRQSKRYRKEREEQLRREYEAKSILLRDTNAHNHRIRQFLNRISNGLKEYDSLQSSERSIPGVNQRKIPKDVLDTFGHDPSAVTHSTTKLRGWRAVEDIDQRVHRQRATLRTFLNSVPHASSNEGCILDEAIDDLLQDLTDLELKKDEIVKNIVDVEKLLGAVQGEHRKLKEKYNGTLSRVSIVYPELSNIVALEESYKDQYQQFWDLGMDALTLLLDTVTPFWRTYGKTIGEDVRDFLIIPLYRNEFTGEVKRYRIKEIPRRSLRHWVGLGVFFWASIAVNILQFRAAITSLMHARLPMIPYDGVRWTALPFFWVGIIIQWLAVVIEFVIVFLQLGVIIWWTGWSVKLLT